MTSSTFDTALEDTIVKACAQHAPDFPSFLGDHRHYLVVNGFFVKFGNYSGLYPEYETLMYLFQCSKDDTDAPRIPEPVHFFQRNRWAYLVMEYINFKTPREDFPQRVVKAVQWLRDCPVPPDRARIGPLGSGPARHSLFKDFEACLEFSSTLALERFLNKAIKRLPRKTRLSTVPISLCNEQLIFTQSDIDQSNFGVDDEGMTCLFGFATVGLLPESFANLTMSWYTPFMEAVTQHSCWSSSSNLETMERISPILWMSSGTLGLDKDGNPIPSKPRLKRSSHMIKQITDEGEKV